MASLSSLVMNWAKKAAASKIASAHAAAAGKEKKRKGWSNILGFAGGLALDWAGAAALTALTGGVVNPVVLKLAKAAKELKKHKKWLAPAAKGFSHFLAKGAADKATKALAGDPGIEDIQAGKFGFGEEEAKTLREGLETSRETDMSVGSLAKDVALQYVAAGVEGKLKGIPKSDKSIVKGEGWSYSDPDVVKTTAPIPGMPEDVKDISSLYPSEDPRGLLPLEDMPTVSLSEESSILEQLAKGKKEIAEQQAIYDNYQSLDPVSKSFIKPPKKPESVYKYGGQVSSQQVPHQEELMALVELSQKAYDGTPLEETEQLQPTIADYFASQNKTLSGNNIQSLAQEGKA